MRAFTFRQKRLRLEFRFSPASAAVSRSLLLQTQVSDQWLHTAGRLPSSALSPTIGCGRDWAHWDSHELDPPGACRAHGLLVALGPFQARVWKAPPSGFLWETDGVCQGSPTPPCPWIGQIHVGQG